MKRTPKEQMLWKMNNVLRGQAMFVKEDTITSAEDKLEYMRIIESFKQYLDHFDEYNQVIQEYERRKQLNKGEQERQ